jgi:transposase
LPTCEPQVEQRLHPYEEAMTLLQSIPGIQEVAAAAIISEIGVDMARFPSAKHLASWVGVCPGNKQSGGKRLSGATRTGNTYLRAMLGEVAWIISRMKDNYLSAQYHRLTRRRGKQKAIVAVSHSLIVIIYHILRDKKPYSDLGGDYFDKLDTARVERHHIRRLEQLGYDVTLTPKRIA